MSREYYRKIAFRESFLIWGKFSCTNEFKKNLFFRSPVASSVSSQSNETEDVALVSGPAQEKRSAKKRKVGETGGAASKKVKETDLAASKKVKETDLVELQHEVLLLEKQKLELENEKLTLEIDVLRERKEMAVELANLLIRMDVLESKINN